MELPKETKQELVEEKKFSIDLDSLMLDSCEYE